MKRCMQMVLCGGLVLALAQAGAAGEPPYRALIQGLRDRHEADLALQYLQWLQKHKPPASVVAVLPLELARTHVALAEQSDDAHQRLLIYDQAHEEFDKFLKSRPSAALDAEARFDLARLQRLRGKARMLLVSQEESQPSRRQGKLRARADFEAAAGSLQQAATNLANQITKLAPDDEAAQKSLTEDRLRADFERALNMFDELETFGDSNDESVKRAAMAQNAINIFKQVIKDDPDGLLGWKARAWLIRCYQETDSADQAQKAYLRVTKTKKKPPPPAEAVRLAKYFHLMGIRRDPNVRGNPLKALVDEGHKWLRDYRSDVNTPEGEGVRLLLADALTQQAGELPKNRQREARPLYNEAQTLYDRLAARRSEFSQRARQGKIRLLVQRFAGQPSLAISRLRTFEECYIRAQVEMARLKDDDKKLEGDKARERRQQHMSAAIRALQHGLDLATPETPAADRIDAQQLLTFVYLAADHPYEAAVEGEYTAQTEPKSAHAAVAGCYALEAYARLLAQEEAGDKRDLVLEADRSRLHRLAQYIVQTWPDEGVTDLARHQLGDQALRDKNYNEAIHQLGQIRPTYSAYTTALFDLSTAALQAAQDKQTPLPGQPPYLQQAIAALERVPDPTGASDIFALQGYFNAKLRLGGLLFQQHRYAELTKLADQLKKRFAESTLDAKVRTALQPGVDSLPFFARYGEAEAAFTAKNYAKAETLLTPIVQQASAKVPELKAPALLRRGLGLALRTDLQLGKTEPARQILDQLLHKKTADDEDTTILSDLVQQLGDQVNELRRQGDSAKDELQKTTAAYTQFLDEMQKRWNKDGKITSEQLRFLAVGYTRLEAHDKAAELLRQVPRPAPSTNPDPDTRAQENQERQAFYHAVRLSLCRELRLAKKYGDADTVLTELLRTPLGKRSLDTRWEKLLLLQDKGEYYEAAKGWNKLMSDLHDRLNDSKTLEQYFECYYNFVFSYYKHAAGMKSAAKRLNGLKHAANFIVQLENSRPDMGGNGLKKRYDDLLQSESDLKEQYDALKGNAR